MYKIYEIRCNETDEVYIGKTTKTLKERLSKHKYSDSCTSKQIILREDYVMSEIDKCDTEEESIFLESYYIRNTDNCINRNIPGRTKQEWYEENKDEILERYKIYSEQNKEKRKEYYEQNKDEILIRKKEYHEKNKDKISEKRKEYYEKNKDEINEKRKETYTCECGKISTIQHKARHERSQRHINFINSK